MHPWNLAKPSLLLTVKFNGTRNLVGLLVWHYSVSGETRSSSIRRKRYRGYNRFGYNRQMIKGQEKAVLGYIYIYIKREIDIERERERDLPLPHPSARLAWNIPKQLHCRSNLESVHQVPITTRWPETIWIQSLPKVFFFTHDDSEIYGTKFYENRTPGRRLTKI